MKSRVDYARFGEFVVRHAAASEVGAVSQLATQAALVNLESKSSGFLYQTFSYEGYLHRLFLGHTLGLFEYHHELAGYFTGFDSGLPAPQEEEMGWYVELFKFAKKWADLEGIERYFFLDQFVVAPQFRNKGLGGHFLELVSDLVYLPTFIGIPARPVQNPQCHWIEERGFNHIGYLQIQPPKNETAYCQSPTQGQMVWSMYFLPKAGYRTTMEEPRRAARA